MGKILSIACVTPAERAGKTMPIEKFLARVKKINRSNVTVNFDQKASQSVQVATYECISINPPCIAGSRNGIFGSPHGILSGMLLTWMAYPYPLPPETSRLIDIPNRTFGEIK